MKEYALLLGGNRSLVGIVTENDTFDPNRKRKIGAVLLNVGLIHHIGPSRIYVKMAREFAVLGIVALRFDLSGIGDSRPRSDSLPQEAAAILEVREAMDYLQRVKGVDEIVLISACASSPLALLVSEVDTRVIGCVLTNPMTPRTDQTSLMRSQQYYWNHALLRMDSWLKLFKLQIDFKHILQLTYSQIKAKFFSNHNEVETDQIIERLSDIFNTFKERNIKVLVISSDNEIGIQFMKEMLGKKYLEIERAGIIKTEILPKTDHSVTPLRSQEKLLAHVVDWMKALRA